MNAYSTYPPDERDFLAAEYALGVLARDEAQALDPLMQSSADFASRVWAWRDRLAPLANRIAWVEPSAIVWQRIETAMADVGSEPDGDPVPVDDSTTLDLGRPVAEGGEVIRLRRSVRTWRTATIVSTVLAAAAVIAITVLPPAPIAPPQEGLGQPTRFVAMLAPPGSDGHGWVAAVDINTRQIALVPLEGTTAPSGQVQELWFIRDADTAPRSLGVINATAQIAAPEEALTSGGTLAVSLEPPGGSPTGAPTGPVVFVGELKPAE